MRTGHGDDAYRYAHITHNFSSNVYNAVNHDGLFAHLAERLPAITHYPEPEPYSLESALARRLQLESADEVCVTNGATEAIYLLAATYARSVSAIWTPTFSEYADACRLQGHRILSFAQLEDLPAEARMVWLCNPNNPTGKVHSKALLQACIERHPETFFVIDQSYACFTRQPLFTPAEAVAWPHVVLIHSFTKQFAIPGLRLGYLTAQRGLLHEVRARRMPWSVNQPAIEAGHYLLTHEAEYSIPLSDLLAECERVAQTLVATNRIEVLPSDTHFLLARLRNGSAAELKEYLAREHGILIRDAANFQGLDKGCFRLAVQTPSENDFLLQHLVAWITSA